VRFSFLKNFFLLQILIILFLFASDVSFSQEEKSHNELSKTTIQNTESNNPKESENQVDIIEKVVDHDYVDFYFFGKLKLPQFPPVHIGGLTIDFSFTKSLFMMLLSSIILILFLKAAARKNSKNPVPKGIGNFVEVIMVFIRDEIVVPNIGKEGLRLLPFFFTVFFFILFANIIGLIPFFAQPTKNINVTSGLALITFFMIQIMGIKKYGFFGYFKGLIPGGIPAFVLPIMIIVEFIGLFTKPFALLMRLFANINAGSIIILSLISLIFIMSYAGIVIAVPFSIFIYFLELFVALLQAYIFTMLSSIFISMAMHQH
jgi:F-type H+-transporting ATPase subunit a